MFTEHVDTRLLFQIFQRGRTVPVRKMAIFLRAVVPGQVIQDKHLVSEQLLCGF